MKKNHPITLAYAQLADAVLAENPVMWPRIARAALVAHEDVPQLLAEVIKYLKLIEFTGQRLTPSVAVDMAWHEFILFTRSYHQFCETHFGRYIHHHPGGEQAENQRQFIRTLRAYALFLGEPPHQFWGHEATEVWKQVCE